MMSNCLSNHLHYIKKSNIHLRAFASIKPKKVVKYVYVDIDVLLNKAAVKVSPNSNSDSNNSINNNTSMSSNNNSTGLVDESFFEAYKKKKAYDIIKTKGVEGLNPKYKDKILQKTLNKGTSDSNDSSKPFTTNNALNGHFDFSGNRPTSSSWLLKNGMGDFLDYTFGRNIKIILLCRRDTVMSNVTNLTLQIGTN